MNKLMGLNTKFNLCLFPASVRMSRWCNSWSTPGEKKKSESVLCVNVLFTLEMEMEKCSHFISTFQSGAVSQWGRIVIIIIISLSTKSFLFRTCIRALSLYYYFVLCFIAFDQLFVMCGCAYAIIYNFFLVSISYSLFLLLTIWCQWFCV